MPVGPGSILTAEPLWGFGVLGLLEVGVLSRGWGWGARQLLYFNAKREFSRGGRGPPGVSTPLCQQLLHVIRLHRNSVLAHRKLAFVESILQRLQVLFTDHQPTIHRKELLYAHLAGYYQSGIPRVRGTTLHFE